ncbi:MAG: hypothetical protein ACRDWD_06010 [Acidimicrobiia bacterium]
MARYALPAAARFWYGAELEESPLGLPPANWPAKATGTGELPEASEPGRRFSGGSLNNPLRAVQVNREDQGE